MGEVAIREEHLPVREQAPITPMGMLQMAVQQGADLDKLEKLMALQERWEASEARKAFTVAMAGFKAEPIEIIKRKQVAFNDVAYKHAELSDITDVVGPALAKHDLSYRWDIRQDGHGITVECILTHIMGHSERVTMSAPADNSGKKNAIQQIASTTTYLSRYTLLALTGMSTKGQDDDGREAGAPEPISEAQALQLHDLLAAAEIAEARLLKWLSLSIKADIASVEAIPVSAFGRCVAKIKGMGATK